MLTLPIKKKWFDMILSGEKKEEYRKIKSYYISRSKTAIGVVGCKNVDFLTVVKVCTQTNGGTKSFEVMFRNGYSKTSPSFIAKCTLSVGTGKEEWGAENGKEYFILTVREILKGSEDFI